MSIDIEPLRAWVGRTESSADTVAAAPIAALSATLDRDDPLPQRGDPLPILWHWLYFLPMHRQSELGVDGHARLGGFLPPVPLPRRMYAGNRVDIIHPLGVGDVIFRRSRIVDVSQKEGRTGPLVFVRVRHEISRDDRLAVTEEQDIVYRNNPGPDDPPPRVQRAPEVRPGGARSIPTKSCCSATRRSRSTAIAFITIGRSRHAFRATRVWWSTVR